MCRRPQLRGKFIGAELLDALGFAREAERLFDEVVQRDIEHELYKDAFLDLLYIYGRHVKAGGLEKAARVRAEVRFSRTADRWKVPAVRRLQSAG